MESHIIFMIPSVLFAHFFQYLPRRAHQAARRVCWSWRQTLTSKLVQTLLSQIPCRGLELAFRWEPFTVLLDFTMVGDTLVVNNGYDREVFDSHGRFLCAYRAKGDEGRWFDLVGSPLVDFMCLYREEEIRLETPDGELLAKWPITSHSKPGESTYAQDLVLHENKLYVFHRTFFVIHSLFDHSSERRNWDPPLSNPGRVKHMAIYKGEIFIADDNILVYSDDGHKLREWGVCGSRQDQQRRDDQGGERRARKSDCSTTR